MNEIQILRRGEVERVTSLSRSTIYNKLNPKSSQYDVDFPRPIKLGGCPSSSVGWIKAEIVEWIMRRIEKREVLDR